MYVLLDILSNGLLITYYAMLSIYTGELKVYTSFH